MERVVRLRDALVRAAGRKIHFCRAFHGERLVRAFAVKLLDEGVEVACRNLTAP
jgi:hypothetical protein